MKSTSASVSRLAVMLVILAMSLTSTVLINGQEAEVMQEKGVPSDWTHQHLVFSHPGTADEAIRNGTYERWLQISTDPRYIVQQQKRSANASGAALQQGSSQDVSTAKPVALEPRAEQADARVQAREEDAGAIEMSLEEREAAQVGNRRLPSGLVRAIIPPPVKPADSPQATKKKKRNRIKKDWSEDLGNNGTTGLGEFPATFTTGGTSCSDFAIFNTGLPGTSGQANIVAYDNIYSTCNGGVPTTYWAYNTGTLGAVSAAISNSVVFSLDGTQVAFVQSVPYSIAAFGTETANLGTVPVTNSTITVGSTTYTWKTTTSITTVNQMSTHGITLETEIAQTLYAALTGSRANCPASNTTCISASQTANSSVTATVLGETVTVTASCGAGTCGNTVVFTQSSTATGMNISPTNGFLSPGSGAAGVGGAQLVVLKWAAGGTLTSPTTLTSNGSYPNCTAPCMISLPFNGTPNDTNSAQFVDYPTGTAYVGDDAGKLHKFTNIFSSVTPVETTASWPVTVNTNASLGSPVYDPVSKNIFVGDYLISSSSLCEPSATKTISPCGYLYSVNSSTEGVTKSAQLDYNFGIIDSPVVDPSAARVYAFAGDDGTTSCTASTPCAAVYQFPVSSLASGTKATVGPGYEFMLSGTFDNAYYNSSAPTGNLYVIGNTGAANNTLYQIPINSNVMSPSIAGPEVSNSYSNGYYAAGLQVNENYAGGTNDYIFLSVLAYGVPSGCTAPSLGNGCVIGYNVYGGSISPGTLPTGAAPAAGGTSGIVVDNGTTGPQNIYFSTLLNQGCTTSGGNGGCAIQLSQSKLQ